MKAKFSFLFTKYHLHLVILSALITIAICLLIAHLVFGWPYSVIKPTFEIPGYFT